MPNQSTAAQLRKNIMSPLALGKLLPVWPFQLAVEACVAEHEWGYAEDT